MFVFSQQYQRCPRKIYILFTQNFKLQFKLMIFGQTSQFINLVEANDAMKCLQKKILNSFATPFILKECAKCECLQAEQLTEDIWVFNSELSLHRSQRQSKYQYFLRVKDSTISIKSLKRVNNLHFISWRWTKMWLDTGDDSFPQVFPPPVIA